MNIALAGSFVVSTPSVSPGTSVCAFIQPLIRENDAPNCSECLPASQLTVLSRFQLLPLRLDGAALVVALVSADADVGEADVEAGLVGELARGRPESANQTGAFEIPRRSSLTSSAPNVERSVAEPRLTALYSSA